MLSKQSTTSSKYSDESAEVGAPTGSPLPPRMMSPTMVQLPPSSVASPVLGAGSVRSVKSPPPPISPRTPPIDTSSIRMVPKSPDSVRSGNSNSSVLTSPFSQQQHQDRPSLDTQLMQDLPPVPPAKSPSTSPVLAYRAPSYGLAHSENAQYQQQHGEHEQDNTAQSKPAEVVGESSQPGVS